MSSPKRSLTWPAYSSRHAPQGLLRLNASFWFNRSEQARSLPPWPPPFVLPEFFIIVPAHVPPEPLEKNTMFSPASPLPPRRDPGCFFLPGLANASRTADFFFAAMANGRVSPRRAGPDEIPFHFSLRVFWNKQQPAAARRTGFLTIALTHLREAFRSLKREGIFFITPAPPAFFRKMLREDLTVNATGFCLPSAMARISCRL